MIHTLTGIWFRVVGIASRPFRRPPPAPRELVREEQAWLITIASILEFEMAQSYRQIADDAVDISYAVQLALLRRAKYHAGLAQEWIEFATELLSNAREANPTSPTE